MFLGAALSGSVLVFSLWPPLSASQRGMAVALLSGVLAFHFLLAAGLQLYFFRYANAVVPVTDSSGGLSHGNALAADSSLDKVTELQSLNLVQYVEGNHESTILAATTNAKTLPTVTNNIVKKTNVSALAIAPKSEKPKPISVTTNKPDVGYTTLLDASSKNVLAKTTGSVTGG